MPKGGFSRAGLVSRYDIGGYGVIGCVAPKSQFYLLQSIPIVPVYFDRAQAQIGHNAQVAASTGPANGHSGR